MNLKRILITVAVLAALLMGASSAMALVTGRDSTTLPAEEPAAAETPGAKDKSAVDLKKAEALLATLQAKYRHLDGLSVSIAPTPAGEQAVAYYTDGEIIISPDRSATIQRILAHEVWHVIDWRDNGRLDWGEDLPPTNASEYLK